jgi:hypothetical protein
MRHSWAVLLISAATLPVMLGLSSAGVAQTAESQPRSADDGPPPGGCTPIGITASGDIVFPMTCKDFIERHKAADRAATAAAETKPVPPEASKAPDAVETAKAPATPEAGKAPTAIEAGKALTTGEANRAAATTTDVSTAPAAVEAGKAPTAPDSGKPDEKGATAAPVKAQTDEAEQPSTKQAAVSPESADSAKSSAEPATTAALDKRAKGRNRIAGGPDCTRYRTYNPASGTYRDFSGRRRSCP